MKLHRGWEKRQLTRFLYVNRKLRDLNATYTITNETGDNINNFKLYFIAKYFIMNNENLLFMEAIEGKYFYIAERSLLTLQTNVKIQIFYITGHALRTDHSLY